MSKRKIYERRRRAHRIRIIKRASGGAAVLIAAVLIGGYCTSGAEGASGHETAELTVESIQTTDAAQDAPETETESAVGQQSPRTYSDVDFVTLPVDMPETEQITVFSICQEENIAFPLVMAIIEQESDFDGTARSTTGDSGYMQINDINVDALAKMGYTDLFDTEQNVRAGISILKEHLEMFGCGNVTFALMAYNLGAKGAQDMIDAGIYETEYTREILTRADAFSSYIDSAEQ